MPEFGRSMWALLGSFLIQHAGYYLALPFLAVMFTQKFGLTAAQAGIVLGSISLAYQFAGVIGGPLSDRIGRLLSMVLGLLLQTTGFLFYAWVRSMPAMLGAGVLIGSGGGLFAPAARAGIAALPSHEEERTIVFSMRGIAANIGMSIGPLLGALLSDVPPVFFGAAAAFHAVLAVLLPFFLPSGCEGGACAAGVGGAIVWGLGTATGNLVGGQAIATARQLGRPGLPRFLFAAIAAVTAAGLLALKSWPALRRALQVHAEADQEKPIASAVAWRPPESNGDVVPEGVALPPGVPRFDRPEEDT